MPSSNPDRYYMVGETVVVRVRIAKPGTKQPLDADVSLVSVRRAGVDVAGPLPVFVREAEGDYAVELLTAGWSAGTYDLVVRVADGLTRVALPTDRFVLRAS